MKRYEFNGQFFAHSARGRWVHFNDYTEEVQGLNDQVTRLTQERDALKRALENLTTQVRRVMPELETPGPLSAAYRRVGWQLNRFK